MEAKEKGKKGKKSAAANPEVPLNQQAAKLSAELADLERILQSKTAETNAALVHENEARERLLAIQEKQKSIQEETTAIASDHTRMYKTLQTEMIRRIEDMEATLETQASEKEICEQSIKDLIEEKEGVTLRKLKRSQKLLESKVASITNEFEKMVLMLSDSFESHTRRLDF